jgi:hypothetical protein
MICPNCSSKALFLSSWPGGRHRSRHEPNVFSQYRCPQGHYFETLSVLNGTLYQEHVIPIRQRTSTIKSITMSMN